MSNEHKFTPDVEAALYKRGITVATIKKYASERLPNNPLTANLNIVARLYLQEKHGVIPDGRGGNISSGLTSVAELKDGVFSKMKVLVSAKCASSCYIGCPLCKKAAERGMETGVDIKCVKCGRDVKTTMLYWHRYVVGDASGEVVAKFAPSVDAEEDVLTGRTITAEGRLVTFRDSTEFMITVFKVAEDVVKVAQPEAAAVKPSTPPAGNTGLDAMLVKMGNAIRMFSEVGEMGADVIKTRFFDKHAEKFGGLTFEEALGKAGYSVVDGRVVKTKVSV